MNKLIKAFIENNKVYNKSLDSLINDEIKLKHNKEDFSIILLILGEKELYDSNLINAQYISSQMIKLHKEDKIILTKEHLDFVNKIERVTKSKFNSYLKRSLFISIFMSIIIFLILVYIGKLSLEISAIISVLLFLIDNLLIKKDKNSLFNKFTAKMINKNADTKNKIFIENNI